MRRDVFQAIADPTRREIIDMIAQKSLHLNLVAEKFDISRPAISKHIKILTECGLITIKQHGRHRYCQANLEKLNEVSAWVEEYKRFWTKKLDALETYLEELQKKPSKKQTKTKSAHRLAATPGSAAGSKKKKHVTGKRKR
jgi:DNA-binding transcriptional ArsR family regulator